MVVTLRDQLKATKAQLAEAEANKDHPTTPIYAHIENSASEEERYRQQTASLINHLTEQAQLAEQREQQNTQLLRIVRSGHYEFAAPYWDNVSQEAMRFVRGCLQLEPDSRATPEQALHGAWLTSDDEPATPSSATYLPNPNAVESCRRTLGAVARE